MFLLTQLLIFNFYFYSLCIEEPLKISVSKSKKFKEETYTPYMINLITEDTEEKKNNVDLFVVLDALEDYVVPYEIIEFIMNKLSSNDRIAIFSNSYEYNLKYITEENKELILNDIYDNFPSYPNYKKAQEDSNDSNLLKAANYLKSEYQESSSRIPVILTYNYGYTSINDFKKEYANSNIPFTIYSISTSNSKLLNRGNDLNLVKLRDGYLYRIKTEDLKIGVLPFVLGNIQTIFAKKAQVTIKSNYSLKLLGKDLMYSVELSENEKEIKINLLQIPYGRKITFAIGVTGDLKNDNEVLEINVNYKTIDNNENNINKKKLYLKNENIKEETFVDYIYFYSLNEALNAFDLYDKGENENALSILSTLYSDIQTNFPEKNLLTSLKRLKSSNHITSFDAAHLLFLSRRPGMAYNVLYEDSNKFTKKLKNSLYEFSIPEDANLFTVSANNVREINLNSLGEEKGAFIYLYIISIKNGYVQYNNNSELLYINRNDSLVILNSETEIRLFITNEDENYPIKLYYWISYEITNLMTVRIPRNLKVLLGLFYSSFKLIFYTQSYQLNDETLTFRMFNKKTTESFRTYANIYPKYYFGSSSSLFNKMEYTEGTDPIYYFSQSLLMGYTNFSQLNPIDTIYNDYKFSLTEPYNLNDNFVGECVYTDATDEYSPTPDNIYIYQSFTPNLRYPHLYLLRKKEPSHRLIRIEFSINTQLYEIAINKYKRYIPNEDYFYSTNKDFQIKSTYQFGRRILYIYLPENINEIILSVFSNEKFHIPKDNQFNSYVFKYNSGVDENDFSEYYLLNKTQNETKMIKKQNGDYLNVTIPKFQIKKGESIKNQSLKLFINLHYSNFIENYIHNQICINYLFFNIIDNLKKKLTMNNVYEYNSLEFYNKDIMVNIIGFSIDQSTILFLEKNIIYYDNNTLVKITNDNVSNTDLGNSFNLYDFTINDFDLNQTNINEKIIDENDFVINTSDDEKKSYDSENNDENKKDSNDENKKDSNEQKSNSLNEGSNDKNFSESTKDIKQDSSSSKFIINEDSSSSIFINNENSKIKFVKGIILILFLYL